MSCNKESYSEKEANTIANSFKNGTHRKKVRNKVPIRSYYCRLCHAYHLTSKRIAKHKNKIIDKDV